MKEISNITLVSIVIPVYNVEKYVEECVKSVLKQTYKDIEIILVVDGATDSSGEICDNLKKQDNRIVVIHKKNGGLSDARNVGIANAKGKYVCFIDSDDIVSDDYVQSMMNNMVNGIKMVACGYCRYYDSGKKQMINYNDINRYFEGIEAQKYLNILGYYNVSACNKMFDKALFNDIKFPIGRKSEDWYVMYKLIETAGGIYYNSDVKYFYRQRRGSITKSTNVNEDAIEAAKEVYRYYCAKNWQDAIPYAAQSLAFANIGVYNAYLCGKRNGKKMKAIRKDMIKLKHKLTYNMLTNSRKIQLSLFLKCRFLYDITFKIYDLKRAKS